MIGVRLTLPKPFLFVLVFCFCGAAAHPNKKDSLSVWGKAQAYVDTAWEYLYVDPEETRRYAQELLILADEEGLIRPKSSAHSLLGLYHETTGRYESAIRHYHTAIEILAAHDSLRPYLSSPYANISIVYHYTENYEKAIEYRQKALELELDYGYTRKVMNSYIALANFHKKLDNIDSSLLYFRKVLKHENEHPSLAALAYGNLGDIYLQRDQWDSALYAFQYNYDFVDSSGSATRYEEMGANYDLAGYYILRENFKLARPYLDSAYKIAESIHNTEFKADLLNLYSQFHEGVGNIPRAFEYYKQSRILRDSITGADVKSTIAQLETAYRHEKQRAEIRELRADAEIKDLTIERQEAEKNNLAMLAIFIGVILLLILIFYIFLRRKSKKLKQQNEIIKQSHRDLEDMMRESHHRIKNNLQVVSSLLRMQSKNAHTPQARASLMEAFSRIKTIALMHQRLQGTHNFRNVDMHEFIEQLTASIKESLIESGSSIQIEANVDHIQMDTDKSIAIGLVVNEAITNSLKHAFVNDVGRIWVDMHLKEELVSLAISDNGKGVPKSFDLHTDSNLGFRIIKSLTTKLNGKLYINGTEGLNLNITFPAKIPA